jgi:hypothetical protein
VEEITQEQKDQLLREMLFVPCETREHLHTWVKAYLGIDLPGSTVCHTDTDFEPSNSNPMELLWEVYQAARTGDRTKTRFLYYAARGCYKSVLASIVEALCMFHLRRDVGHMAANKAQSKIVQTYLRQYLQRPILRDFMTSKNESEISVTWYEHGNDRLTPAEFKAMKDDVPERAGSYVEKKFQTTVVVATLGGANGLHCSMMVMDELDLTPAEIISEAAMIPNPGKEFGEPAIVLMTSSRKFAIGPVQSAIDNAHKTGTQIRHWNVIDVTSACPPERHLPELPKLKVYYSNDLLTTIKEEEYLNLPEENQKVYKPDMAYEGCVKNCKIFAMCRGRLATEQHSSTRLLRHPADTQDIFIGQPDVEKAQAQLMCWKPSRAGMIYPRLNRAQHLISAADMMKIMTGEEYPPSFGKGQLLAYLATQEVRWFAGVDHGYNHCFAGVLGVKWGAHMFIVDAFEIPGLELDGKIRLMTQRFLPFGPKVFADTSHPGDNTSIGKHGFKMGKLEKGPGSVVDGIGLVRMKLNPVLSKTPDLYFLKGDIGVEVLFDRLLKYAWVIDANTGEPTSEPNETNDDGCDALRYLIMSVFAPRGKVTAARAEERNPLAVPQPQMQPKQVLQQHWNQIMGHVGMSQTTVDPVTGEEEAIPKTKGTKGSFRWDMG